MSDAWFESDGLRRHCEIVEDDLRKADPTATFSGRMYTVVVAERAVVRDWRKLWLGTRVRPTQWGERRIHFSGHTQRGPFGFDVTRWEWMNMSANDLFKLAMAFSGLGRRGETP